MKGPVIPVVVTGVGGGGHGSQIVKALRQAETRYEIIATDASPVSTGFLLADHAYRIVPASDPDYIDRLLALCRHHGARALFHGSEPELRAIAAARNTFEKEDILVPINPDAVLDLCMDKVRTARALEELGFDGPPFASIRSLDDARAFEHLPAILKPSVGGGGSANLFLVQDRRELVAAAAQLLALAPEFIAQAYVGDPESEFTVGVLTDLDGQYLNAIAVRRRLDSALSVRISAPNRSGRSEFGPRLVVSSGISQGEIGRFPEVTDSCRQIADSIGARGPINLQCRRVDGVVRVFEINPRFSGTTSMRAMVGYNEPDVLVRRHLLGERIEIDFEYRSGTILRRLEEVLMPERSFASFGE